MINRKSLRAAIVIPALLAFLACSAWAATSGGKSSHYPGQDCKGCHKGRGKSPGKGTVNTTPPNSPGGTGSTGSKNIAPPATGAPKAR